MPFLGIPAPPDLDELTGRYRSFERDLSSTTGDARWTVLREWDGVRRDLHTYAALTNLRFDQDTGDAAARAAREAKDALQPKFIALDDAIKRRFVSDDLRPDVERAIGSQAFRVWSGDLNAFTPAIEDDLVTESNLAAAYISTIAGIEVDFRGERLNLAALMKYASDPDRSARHDAAAARWTALAERGDELDRIYDELVRLRDRIAHTLGFASFTHLAYQRMHRIGYGPADVARWRDTIATSVVPVAAALVDRAARLLSVDRIALWDEHFLTGPETPVQLGDGPWLMERTIDGFAELAPELRDFAEMMRARSLSDLITRPGKRSGAYCTFLASYDVPYIFANANGTRDDVKTLMHELGHAFQAYSSRTQPVLEYVTPTYELAEVHSMSLEYLSWPVMNRFFRDEAESYRRAHLASAILFLPYGAAIDHFQHLVYEHPNATPEERHAMWRSMEQLYLPWRTYGDLARPSRGAFWQSQQHVYRFPFYYVDYTLALSCALQLWAASHDDRAGTMRRYVELCERGGSGSFGELLATASLVSPFTPGAIDGIVGRVRATLGI